MRALPKPLLTLSIQLKANTYKSQKTLITVVTIIKAINSPLKLLRLKGLQSKPSITAESTAHSQRPNRSHQTTSDATAQPQD
mmetsp:Transcript_17917/g.24560  ORF Transcript_17917/g.24560 Transcript_17917/m.24560 type:complete len:82 (+) Transcript_17917:618-863(+)